MSFKFNSKRISGVPEREDTLLLHNTNSPYELYASDTPFHEPNN
jgi:hypothetical protein